MERVRENIAFWLLPAPAEEDHFGSLIRELASRFDAPFFQPHLTLHGGDVGLEEAVRTARGIPALPRYKLEVDGVYSSDCFIKTLFLRFRPSEEVNQLRTAIGDALQLSNAAEFDPHLSLLYKEMPSPEKAELARTIRIPFQSVSFTGLSVIAHPVEIKTRSDVEAWRTLAHRPLISTTR